MITTHNPETRNTNQPQYPIPINVLRPMYKRYLQYNTLYVINEEQDPDEDYGFFCILDPDVLPPTKPVFKIKQNLKQNLLVPRQPFPEPPPVYSLIYDVLQWVFGSFS